MTSTVSRHVTSIRHRMGRDFDQSIVRRSIILLGLTVPAYVANFGVLYSATHLLSLEQFGVFYVANTLTNVLFSGSLILNMVFTRHLAEVRERSGENALLRAALSCERAVYTWGGAIAAFGFLALIAPLRAAHGESWVVVLLVVLDALTAYVSEIGRAVLQSLRRTVSLGVYTLVWMLLRLGLCIAGMLVFGTVWGALAGIVVSNVAVYLGFRWRTLRRRGAASESYALPNMAALIPAILGFALLVAVSNLDVLVSYLLLAKDDLSVYSASSLLPKGVLTGTLPLLQMIYPMIIGAVISGRATSDLVPDRTILKGAAVITAVTAAAATALWFLSPWLCGSSWGIRACAPKPFGILSLSIVPLALLRFFVVLQFARKRDWSVLWLAVPTVVYLSLAGVWGHSLLSIARGFSAFAAGACVLCLAIWQFGVRRFRLAYGPR